MRYEWPGIAELSSVNTAVCAPAFFGAMLMVTATGLFNGSVTDATSNELGIVGVLLIKAARGRQDRIGRCPVACA
jgi:hypothetical protein